MRFKKLYKFILSEFSLGNKSIHGPIHWKMVEKNGFEIAETNGADKEVIKLFAILHDCKRENEDFDSEHGPRAKTFCQWLQKNTNYLQLTDEQFKKLCYACNNHTRGEISSDDTIGTCWDADRLDLPRVGIIPQSKYMSTKEGKKKAIAIQGNKVGKEHKQAGIEKSWWNFWERIFYQSI
ncbi:MAG: hypothetical protein H8E60_03105 [Candidatus Marinimicrobia bacterium]|nr:hypothetical protein [Candidatus Neomarinimicrobiota bacterium]